MTMTICNVRALEHGAIDLIISNGVIQTINPGSGQVGPGDIDGRGQLVFPGFVDAHTHMDKTLMGLGWHRHEVGPLLLDKIEHERDLRRKEGIDSHQQSSRHARAAIATGTTTIRTHVDCDTEIGLTGLEGVLRTKDELKDAVTIQTVAFPQSGMLVRPGTVELLDQALREGADVIGGLDPSTIDRDPVRHLDTVFALAEKHDVDVDIHLHESGELGAFSIELICERTKALGWQGRVVISHAFALGQVNDISLQHLIEQIIDADIAIMSHGPGGHYACPNIKKLREMGVRMCAGNDGVRDAWGPTNTFDMMERTFLMIYRNNLRRDDDIEEVLRINSEGGADAMRIPTYGLQVGAEADLFLCEGETHVEAVISRPPRTMVMKRGQIVASDGVCLV